VELFLDPALKFSKLKIASRLLKKQLGFRMLMDLIPLDATLVKGSHGICPVGTRDYPLVITERAGLLSKRQLAATDIYDVIKRQVSM